MYLLSKDKKQDKQLLAGGIGGAALLGGAAKLTEKKFKNKKSNLISNLIKSTNSTKDYKEVVHKMVKNSSRNRLLDSIAAGGLIGAGVVVAANKIRKSRADKGKLRGKYIK